MFSRIKAKINLDKNFKDILKGSGLTFIAKIMGTILGLATSLIIARYYGAEVLGVVAIITSVLQIFGVLALMGIDTAILRLIPEYLQKYSVSSSYKVYKKSLAIVLTSSLFVTFFLYLSSAFLSEYVFHKDYLQYFFIVASLFIGVRAIATLNQETIRGLQSINLYAMIQFLPSLLSFLLIIIMTFFFYYKYNPVYISFAVPLIMLIITYIVMQRLFSTITNTHKTKYSPSKREIMVLSFPMLLTASMHIVIGQSDTIMLGMMRSEVEVGIYSIVLKIAMMTSFILIAVNSIAAPKFSQLYHSGQIEELKIVAQKTTRLVFWSSLPIILIYIFMGQFILGLFGSEFSTGYYALIFFALGQFINVSTGSVAIFLNMTGHQKALLYIVIFGGVLNIILNLLLIPQYGIEGAAIASMVSVSVWNIIAVFYIKSRFGFFISFIQIKS